MTSKTGTSVGNEIWNVPNQISFARLVLSVILFGLMVAEWYWLSFIAFVVAAGTDWIDGWWARRFQQITQLGRILDPFCDKILICGTFILLAVAMDQRVPWYAAITGWMAVIIVGREMLVTALRSFIEQGGGDFSAKMAGKLKMWFQCIAAGAGLLALAILRDQPQQALPIWLTVILAVFVWLAVVSTVYSGVGYVQVAGRSLLEASRRAP